MSDDGKGRIELDGQSATLRFVRHLPHPIDAVWAAITEPAQRAAWMGLMTLEERAGGTIVIEPTDPPAPADAKRVTGRVLVWDPPHVFEHEWHQRIVEPSVVRYELTQDGQGTRLEFTHRGLGARNAGGFLPGTHAYIDMLEAHLAGEPVPAWPARYAKLAEAHYGGSKWGTA